MGNSFSMEAMGSNDNPQLTLSKVSLMTPAMQCPPFFASFINCLTQEELPRDTGTVPQACRAPQQQAQPRSSSKPSAAAVAHPAPAVPARPSRSHWGSCLLLTQGAAPWGYILAESSLSPPACAFLEELLWHFFDLSCCRCYQKGCRKTWK